MLPVRSRVRSAAVRHASHGLTHRGTKLPLPIRVFADAAYARGRGTLIVVLQPMPPHRTFKPSLRREIQTVPALHPVSPIKARNWRSNRGE